MNPALVSEEDLKAWIGISDRAGLRLWASQVGLKFLPGSRRRLCTTIEALNAAMGVQPSQQQDLQPPVEFL